MHARLRGRVLVLLATEAAQTFLVALFVFSLFQRLVTRHLSTLAAYTRGLGPGHLDAPLRLRRGEREGLAPDALKEVSAALNGLRESLRHELGERQRVEAGSAFLARAGAVLLESLDWEKVLPRIASLFVGALADWCVIDLREDGTVRRVDEAHFQLARELGLRSLLTVPLVARGLAVGASTFASAEPGRYGRAERSLAEELARRAAIAIDNARLYRRAEEAIRLRETFLGVVGHELRTPLLPLRLQSLLRRSRGVAALEPAVLLGEVAAATNSSTRPTWWRATRWSCGASGWIGARW